MYSFWNQHFYTVLHVSKFYYNTMCNRGDNMSCMAHLSCRWIITVVCWHSRVASNVSRFEEINNLWSHLEPMFFKLKLNNLGQLDISANIQTSTMKDIYFWSIENITKVRKMGKGLNFQLPAKKDAQNSTVYLLAMLFLIWWECTTLYFMTGGCTKHQSCWMSLDWNTKVLGLLEVL